MSDSTSENDPAHPSQAEGEDPGEQQQPVLEPEGKPSQAEGDDPDRPDDQEVLDPADPAEPE